MSEAQLTPAEQFEDPAQQRSADFFGMWVFLGSEVMLFGSLFLMIAYYRVMHPEAVRKASEHLHLAIGAVNTAILLTTSLIMALAVLAARAGRVELVARLLFFTACGGLAFLMLKGYEYWKEYKEGLVPGVGPAFPLDDPASELFINIYFASTALHAVHLVIAVAIVGGLAVLTAKGHFMFPQRQIVPEIAGLYWHFVDVVWLFLFPVLYLV